MPRCKRLLHGNSANVVQAEGCARTLFHCRAPFQPYLGSVDAQLRGVHRHHALEAVGQCYRGAAHAAPQAQRHRFPALAIKVLQRRAVALHQGRQPRCEGGVRGGHRLPCAMHVPVNGKRPNAGLWLRCRWHLRWGGQQLINAVAACGAVLNGSAERQVERLRAPPQAAGLQRGHRLGHG
jgi:hypothetical protein